MKKTFILLSIALFTISCNDPGMSSGEKTKLKYEVVEIDGCEYIERDGASYFLIHKQNCKFCFERNAMPDDVFHFRVDTIGAEVGDYRWNTQTKRWDSK